MKPITCLVTATVLVIVATAACSTGTQVEAERALRDGCADWNTSIFFRVAEVSDVTRCLQAGADPNARDNDGKLPFYYAEDNDQLKGTDAYWKLNDARFQ